MPEQQSHCRPSHFHVGILIMIIVLSKSAVFGETVMFVGYKYGRHSLMFDRPFG
jgi:hypothetical protein